MFKVSESWKLLNNGATADWYLRAPNRKESKLSKCELTNEWTRVFADSVLRYYLKENVSGLSRAWSQICGYRLNDWNLLIDCYLLWYEWTRAKSGQHHLRLDCEHGFLSCMAFTGRKNEFAQICSVQISRKYVNTEEWVLGKDGKCFICIPKNRAGVNN